ncbi:lysophospholipid acyltransferase family protein [Flavobacterium sp. RHBU_3]|uniref:lysophospholipid acyltransferase family protein n=1 Tax=Flavobacterium sp. RHBU_3 TaxID=3391184 RepID=UPI0039847094
MQRLSYIVAYPIIWGISILPFPLLYILSDCIYVLVYHIIGYRKKVVRANMRRALPHLTKEELHKTEKKFYHHFCDSFLEMVKTLNMSQKEVAERFVVTNPEALHQMESEGKSAALLTGHYANYEWILGMSQHLTTHKGFGIYKPMKNIYFDRLVRRIRGKLNSELIGVKDVIPTMRKNLREGKHGFYGFVTDQSPMLGSAIHWGKFFGQEVPVQVGGEMLSKKMGLNIAFSKIEKVKRGYYQCTFLRVEGDVSKVPNFEVTDNFMHMLEQQIIKEPAYYLWTHKRFKHCREAAVNESQC